MKNQSLTSYLFSRGWERDDAPAEVIGECGASSDTVGYCEKTARWSQRCSGSHLCAQHAAQAQRLAEAAPAPRIGDVPIENIDAALRWRAERPARCPVCGGLNPGDVTHTRC